jgi:hypothetical protein
MLNPVFRRDTTAENSCKTVSQKSSHLLTEQLQLEPIVWEVVTPDPQGNCSIKLFPAKDHTSYINIIPETQKSVWFQCGRNHGIEKQIIQIPSRFICDQCVLQHIWQTSKGYQYSCADLIVSFGTGGCPDTCLNNGICQDGKCVCNNNYTGTNCGVVVEPSQGIFYYIGIFLFISLLVFVFITVVYLYFNQQKVPMRVQQFLKAHARWSLRSEPIE